MREPNFSFPAQNRASVVISSSMYDRRALDCTATLPLVNSLTHLAYMTSTSPRMREILATDGGLERLVKILTTCQQTDRHSLWKWSLAFQCVVNIGVRGTEAIRTRVVEVGAVHVVLAILENFLNALERKRSEEQQERKRQQQQHLDQTMSALNLPALSSQPSQTRSTPVTTSRRPPSAPSHSQSTTTTNTDPFSIPKRNTFLKRTPKVKQKRTEPTLSSIPLLSSLPKESILQRDEDILLSLQLLAYLSKYPHIRNTFYTNHSRNVFSVVERFTYRLHPAAVIYWAGVIMRNACRKDETQGGIRQCAYMHCGKWERYPREFAKCRRCRKAKYCSKACQSRAWADGHRWWCVERTQHSSQIPTTSSTTAAAVTTSVAGADPQPTEPVMPLDQTTTTDVVPITIDNRQSETDAVNENIHHRPSLSITVPDDTTTENRHGSITSQSRQGTELFYHRQRRNSRSARSLASGSSTEVEVEADNSFSRSHDLMEVD
ncbi:hypothetical protein EC973_006392 [Apophysomyces ossiformis]|uniref:MYND-type domain-containing protein n=1 Tax=Apophysomyces ossiformis TaxID=679940 RepID=A0A8H7EVG3_9FUNG|nr:hypothetical protein EC973_006392 [Apophysomyces ossiformis]